MPPANPSPSVRFSHGSLQIATAYGSTVHQARTGTATRIVRLQHWSKRLTQMPSWANGCYSEVLRRKVAEATECGTSNTGAARLFGASLSSVKRYARMARRGGSLAPKKGSGRPAKPDQNAKGLLEVDVEEPRRPPFSDRRRFLERITGSGLSDSTVRRPRWRSGRAARV